MTETKPPTVEQIVRSMTRAERIDYLFARGWRRVAAGQTQSWRSPDPDDRAISYSLAAAIRTAVAADMDGVP